jgi:protein-S-isoprenylcysteine O-methyltransferase Ste14
MTRSASTPRLRLILVWYLAMIALVAASERPWSQHWSADLARIVGLLLVATAALGRIWCSAFIAGYKDEQLVTSGPYSLCRNPLYLLSMIGGIGIGLASASVTLLLLTFALLAALHLQATYAEEHMMLARHGEAFRRYSAEVPRFLPRKWHAETPPSSAVNFRVFRKSFLDAGSLFVLFAAICACDVLRQVLHWPAVFILR